MNLSSKHKADPSFSLSSMTDVVFLLLIFFMLTSNMVTPSGMPISLPTSKNPEITIQKVNVTVTKNLEVMVGEKKSSIENLKTDLALALKYDASKNPAKGQEDVVVLNIDKDVTTEYLVKVASVATELKAKVTLATKPE